MPFALLVSGFQPLVSFITRDYDIVNLRLMDRRGIFSPVMLHACTALILCYSQHFLADLQLRGRMIASHDPTASFIFGFLPLQLLPFAFRRALSMPHDTHRVSLHSLIFFDLVEIISTPARLMMPPLLILLMLHIPDTFT